VRRDTCNLRNFGSTSNGNWHQGTKSSGGLHAFRIRKRDSVCENCADRRDRNEETEKTKGKHIEVASDYVNTLMKQVDYILFIAFFKLHFF